MKYKNIFNIRTMSKNDKATLHVIYIVSFRSSIQIMNVYMSAMANGKNIFMR